MALTLQLAASAIGLNPSLQASAAPVVELSTSSGTASFRVGETISLQAVATDPDGYASTVEFFAGTTKLGDSSVVFIREPDAGQPVSHSFAWKDAAPGLYTLTAKARDNSGTFGLSKDLRIEVTGGIIPNKSEPTISSIQVEKDSVLVSGVVPPGILKVTLESRERVGSGAWQPRAVQRLDANGGNVSFKIAKSPALELLRLRADTTEPLPASFYQGKTEFNGPVSSAQAGANVPTAIADAAKSASGAEGASTRSVVESDIWKIQGQTLYFFNQYKGLQVIDISVPDAPILRGELSMPAVGEQMYVLDDGTAVLLARDNCSYGADQTSRVVIVDTSAQPRILTQLSVPGAIEESRLVGSALYVASQQYRPSTRTTDGSWEWGSVVSAFDLAKPAAPVARNSLWFSGYGNVITATDEFLFVALRNPIWNAPSTVRCIDISNPDGTMVLASTLNPSGIVQDKFKMNLNGDILSVISERWEQVQNNGQTVTKVETFSLAQPTQPVRLGSLEIARGERLFATRFDGDRVYVVTFLRIDPLWIVDLSNPAKPTISGELHVPGWSTYIQPLGDQLVAVGIDNTNGWRVAVSLFDVTDVRAPKLSAKVPLGENYSWSEATQDEKAFTVLPEAGLILVPYQGYTTNGYATRVQIIDLDLKNRSLKARGVINQAMQPRRATEYNNRILSVSGRELLTVDAADRDNPVLRARTTLSWTVNRLWVSGQHQVQLDEQNSWTGQTLAKLRVVANNSPDTLLATADLTPGLRVLGGTVKNQRLYLAEGRAEEVVWKWFEAEQTSRAVNTNPSAFKLTVFDLSKLPQLVLLGENTTDKADPGYSSDLSPFWLNSDVLIWSARGGYWGPWFRGMAVDAGIAAPGAKMALPWWGGGSGSLIAFNVSDSTQPRFLSKSTFSGNENENRWGYSDPQVVGNLVYASYQTSVFVEGLVPAGEKPPAAEPVKQADGSILMVQPPFGSWIQRYYLTVVDFADPANPTARKPVNIPGQLTGVSHGGAVIYTTGNHWDGRNNTDGFEWLDVVAYDGVSASSVTQFQLPAEWPHPVLINEGIITIGRPGDGKTVKPSIESWLLNESGKFGKLWSTPLAYPAQSFLSLGKKVLVQSSQLDVFDVSNAAQWLPLGTAELPGCLYYDLTRAVDDGASGLWVPLHDYGIRYINLGKPTP